jgi:hypothetical protein
MRWLPTPSRVTRSIENTSAFRTSGSRRMAPTGAWERKRRWTGVEQTARRLVAVRIANLHKTTRHEEQRA